MKSLGNSSAPTAEKGPNPGPATVATTPPVAPTRKRFALTGRSRNFDPNTTAARPDLADVRVADRVFAPHYAAPLPHPVIADATISAVKDGDGVGSMHTGDVFEVLEITALHAWGVAADGTVGFVPLASLGRP